MRAQLPGQRTHCEHVYGLRLDAIEVNGWQEEDETQHWSVIACAAWESGRETDSNCRRSLCARCERKRHDAASVRRRGREVCYDGSGF